ncbi:LruC domain-containing protein [Fulvivirgaceae bacterium BMA12]|uniref:LruC domain-containing protein n=1 Tax=Agaribacillus aureus TaxID=3051825 RepID=A0ABT8LAI5_9BACT|nr:LruC domain-containing protein [Fulvivirgaceae bacterium BMA12]
MRTLQYLNNKKRGNYTWFLVIFLLLSCVSDRDVTPTDKVGEGIEGLVINDNFEYETIQATNISIEVTLQNAPLAKVPLVIYTSAPASLYNEDPDLGGNVLVKGITNENGIFESDIQLPADLQEVFIQTDYIGIPDVIAVPVQNGQVQIEINDEEDLTQGRVDSDDPGNHATSRISRTYTFLGTFNNKGVPDYLEAESDNIDKAFLNDVNQSLPERNPVPVAHPEYLASGTETDLKLNAETDIWVTFVHEGAGYKNVLGFYTYDINNPPASADDITALNVIFPNTSYNKSGGGLRSGDKVKIGRFEAGTGIGWFIVANGFKNKKVGDGNNIFYSNPDFNPETDPALRQHNVLLKDDGRNLILLGFEDLKRDVNSDEDFNDAIFYITASEYLALETNNFERVASEEQDSDNDGIADIFDDYPQDGNKAFNNYYPNENTFGTLAFEDLWPNKGDYDFNDLVVDYQFNQITNGQNEVVEVNSRFIIKAIGAGFANGFGFEMDLAPGDVANVTGLSLQENFINLNANNTEAGQDKATIIVFDNAYNELRHPGGDQKFVNTELSGQYVTPDTMNVNISLTTPQPIANTGLAPYNPFLIVNRERGKEVHLPGYRPTSLASNRYFKTGVDDTDPANGNYYKSTGNLPWAMNIPESFDYPAEQVEILSAHLRFGEWVQSDGFSRQDWYRDEFGYRNSGKVFKR